MHQVILSYSSNVDRIWKLKIIAILKAKDEFNKLLFRMKIPDQHFVFMIGKRKILFNPISIFDNLWSAIGDAQRYSTLCFKDLLDFSQVLYHERKEVSTQHNVNLKRNVVGMLTQQK